jgi:hypothetical protein
VKKKEQKEPEPPRACGFCGPGTGREPGRCYDTHSMCRGTWKGFVPRTDVNPDGEWTCACAAAGHYLPVADAA